MLEGWGGRTSHAALRKSQLGGGVRLGLPPPWEPGAPQTQLCVEGTLPLRGRFSLPLGLSECPSPVTASQTAFSDFHKSGRTWQK